MVWKLFLSSVCLGVVACSSSENVDDARSEQAPVTATCTANAAEECAEPCVRVGRELDQAAGCWLGEGGLCIDPQEVTLDIACARRKSDGRIFQAGSSVFAPAGDFERLDCFGDSRLANAGSCAPSDANAAP